MSTAPIIVSGLTKRYADHQAVAGIDLRVEQGECFALLGPNGAGKTTTVEILEGFRRPNAGHVRVLGVEPAKADRAWRDRVGVVLQTSTGLDLVTPREAITATAAAYSTPREVSDVIEAVGLAPKADDRIGTLSGGQRRRVDVALGIVGRPEVLFLDEPTTGFDPQARRDFWDLIASLRADGTTILLTTHYLDEAEQLADRVGVIAAGRMLGVDTPAQLGGRSESSATVTWLDGDDRRSVTTESPTAEVARLAGHFGGEVPGLQVLRPTLEDTYLAMIAPHHSEDLS